MVELYCVKRTNKNFVENKQINFFTDQTKNKIFNELITHLWNSTLNINYFDFRDELRNIQKENIKDCNFDRVYEYIHDFRNDLDNIDLDNTFIFFIDEDDLIRPNLIDWFRNKQLQNDHIDFYVWDWVQFNINRNLVSTNDQLKGKKWKHTIQTNHCVTKVFYHDNHELLFHHDKLDDVYKDFEKFGLYLWDNLNLSLTIKNFSSLSHLFPRETLVYNETTFKNKAKWYKNLYLDKIEDLNLCDPYFYKFINQVIQLHKELL